MASADIFFDGVVQLAKAKKVSTRGAKRKMYKADNKSQFEKWQPTSEALELFLKHLHEDRNEAGERYEYLRLSLMRFFERRDFHDSDQAADEVINRVMRKLNDGTEIEKSIEAFALGVARIYQFELQRNVQLEKLDSYANLLTPINNVDSKENALLEDKEKLFHLLEECLAEMTEESKNLILSYYEVGRGRAKIDHRKRLAAKHDISVKTLCLRVTRIRAKIEKYLRKKSVLSVLVFALMVCLVVVTCFFKQKNSNKTIGHSINATEQKDNSARDAKEENAKNQKEQNTRIADIRLVEKNDGKAKKANNAKHVHIPAESRMVRVTVAINAKKSYEKYLMEIEKRSKQNIWQSDDTKTLSANNLSTVMADVPAEIFEKGNYTIRVKGRTQRGLIKPVSVCRLKVEK